MTDGVVEKIGWLPLGGYRIGIRSPHGGYFYYAHLSGYEKKFQEGESIEAGDILGYMGNTGYGTEGTKGKFPVHLHLGIYIRTPQTEELSVDPYWILRCIYKNIRNYSY
jgi:murein DD-endopeptidase MepM/ murein hydrolase activator NlpD